MRGITWIEFLVTFSIFLMIFVIFYYTLYNMKIGLLLDKEYVKTFQEFLIASYYYIETKNYSSFESFFNFSKKNFLDISYPVFMVLNDSVMDCFNCITIYYNYSDNSANFLQKVSYNYQTVIDVYVIFLENMDISNCSDYLQIKDYVIKECRLNLTGNSSIKIYPVKNIIYIPVISSFVNFSLYNNTIKLSRMVIPPIIGKSFTFYVSYPGIVVKKVITIS